VVTGSVNLIFPRLIPGLLGINQNGARKGAKLTVLGLAVVT